MLHTNNRLHGDGKVNTGVTTKLSKIKSCNRIVKAYEKKKYLQAFLSGTSHCSPCNPLSLPPVSPCNRCRCISQVDQAEEQDGSGFLSFSCSNKLEDK